MLLLSGLYGSIFGDFENLKPVNKARRMKMRKTALMIAVSAFLAMPAVAHAQSVQFIAKQETRLDLASQILGTTVTNPAGDTLGRVNNLLVDANGQIEGIIIGIGGFMGIAEKNVAVAFDQVTRSTVEGGTVVMVINADKAALEAAPDFVTVDNKSLSVTKELRERASELGQQARETYDRARQAVTEEMSGEKTETTQ
jgi:threonine dehydrogenase-like Zn-dependent dehydrogenase